MLYLIANTPARIRDDSDAASHPLREPTPRARLAGAGPTPTLLQNLTLTSKCMILIQNSSNAIVEAMTLATVSGKLEYLRTRATQRAVCLSLATQVREPPALFERVAKGRAIRFKRTRA